MLERFLCIRPNEKKHAFFFAFLGFAWSIATSSGVALSDALLVKHIGAESLPLTFAITAVGIFCSSGIFFFLYNRMNINQIFVKWIYVAIAFYLFYFSQVLLGSSSPVFFISFKALSYIAQLAFFSCFWTFVDQYFELQNAKRIFGLLYSAIFLGMAVSGAILSLYENFRGMVGMMTLVTGALVLSLFLIKHIQANFAKISDDHQEFVIAKTSGRDLFKSIVTSPFTILLLLFCIILQFLIVITEYEYMFSLEKILAGGSANGLTQFLGRLYFFGSLFNIFFGLFLYGRLIRNMGLNNVILIVPLFFCSLFFGWIFSVRIIFPIMGFLAVEGVLTLVEDNNFNLLLNAVPLRFKNKIRVVCESVIEPCGILMSSLLMIFFKEHSKTMGLAVSIIFLVVTLMMRAYYTKGIFYNLISHLINFNHKKPLWTNKISKKDYLESRPGFTQQFVTLKENEQLFLVECALRFNDLKYLETLLGKMTKFADPIKLKVINIIEEYPSSVTARFLPYFQFWAKQSEEFKEHFYFHLAKMEMLEQELAVANSQSKKPYLKAASLLTLCRQPDATLENFVPKHALIKMLISRNLEENRLAAEAILYNYDPDFKPLLIKLLRNRPEIRLPILKTLARSLTTTDRDLLAPLLSLLEQQSCPDVRLMLVKAIERIVDHENVTTVMAASQFWSSSEKRHFMEAAFDMENQVIYTLEEILISPSYSDKMRLMAGQILSGMSPKLLKTCFQRILQDEIQKAYLYFYHFITIQKSYPYTNLHLLELALKNSYDSILDFIIQIQSLTQKFDKGEYLAQSLHSSHPKTYSHAIETLQKMCATKIYKQIQPLIEKGHEKEFFKYYHTHKFPILSLEELLDHLERSSSPVNRMIVLSLKNRLNIQSIEKMNLEQPKMAIPLAEVLPI